MSLLYRIEKMPAESVATSRHGLSICFVALNAYNVLSERADILHIGGAEMQQTIIGSELAQRGHRVSFVTLDHGQDNDTEIKGIRIIKAYDPHVGMPVLRFPHPRLTGIWHAMARADADIYYQRKGDSLTGVVAAFCRWRRRKFVFALASHYDCLSGLPDCVRRHERVLYRYGLRRADLVLAQTARQQRLVRENFGVNSIVMPSCAPDYGRSLGGPNVGFSARDTRLLWVGRFSPVKRLELLLDVAETNQDLQFDVVGDANSESDYVRHLRTRAESMSNVRLHGLVPLADVHQFYRKTAALICTSRAEGFPNVFLEAWSHGLPVVSTVDPGDLIAKYGLGIVAEDVAGLAGGIRTMLSSEQRWCDASRATLEYFRKNHSIDVVMPRLEGTLLSLANGTRASDICPEGCSQDVAKECLRGSRL